MLFKILAKYYTSKNYLSNRALKKIETVVSVINGDLQLQSR